MTLKSNIPFPEFVNKVTMKFSKSFNGLTMEFKDEDGDMVTLRDDSDYDLAILTAQENGRGKAVGKLEIWCQDST